MAYVLTALRSDLSPKKIIRFKNFGVSEPKNLSKWAFKLGL